MPILHLYMQMGGAECIMRGAVTQNSSEPLL